MLRHGHIHMHMSTFKVLNPMERGCSVFFMEQDMPPSRPISILGIGDVPSCPNLDVGMMAGWFNPNT